MFWNSPLLMKSELLEGWQKTGQEEKMIKGGK